jgi:hypothetical protein
VWSIPVTLAAVYLVAFVVQVPRNVTELGWNSDYAGGFVIAESIAHAGTGGGTIIASAGQWVSLWFGLATAWLPLHHELWAIMPTLLFVFTALTVGWSVAQVADRRAGALAVLLSLVVSPLALAFLMAADAHNTVYPGTALLGAYVIWLTRGAGRKRLVALGVPPLLGVAIGTCLGSDLLVGPAAVLPLAVVGVFALLRRERRSRWVGASALTTVAVAVPVAPITSTVMHSFGLHTIETPAHLAPLAELPARGEDLFRGLKALFSGYLDGPQGTGFLHGPLGVASEIAMCAALLVLVVLGARAAFELVVSGLRKGRERTPAQLARPLHVVYWTASAIGVCGVFWLYAETGGGTALHESYYGTVIFSVAAIVPLLLAGRSPARWLLPAGAAVLFAAALVGLLAGNYLNVSAAVAQTAPSVVKIAEANHVSYGYGGYWQASGLTWNTHGRVTVRPLFECPNPEGADICPFYEMRLPSWYVPRPRRTFLLVDREEAWVRALPNGLGRPLAAYQIGPLQMYIYPYDVASRLGS